MKKKQIVLVTIVIGILTCISYFLYTKYSRENKIIEMISKNTSIVNYYCKINNLKPRAYISVIFGELYSNYNLFDGFDNIRAEYGFDPSAGFGQMRVSTFMWLEDNYADGVIITRSRYKAEAVQKLLNDTINIAYTTFYLKLIKDKLMNLENKEPSIKQLGSFYSIGINHGNRKIIKNVNTPVGTNAEKFYYSNKLIDTYPLN